MNTHIQTDIWKHRIVVVLGLTVIMSVFGTVVMVLMRQPVPELIIALGSVAASGLSRLLIPTPLDRELF